jgi:hypothetical protein
VWDEIAEANASTLWSGRGTNQEDQWWSPTGRKEVEGKLGFFLSKMPRKREVGASATNINQREEEGETEGS